MLLAMTKWLGIVFGSLFSAFRTRRSLALENLVLRQQLAVLKHRHSRPGLTDADRLFWTVISRLWGDWQHACLAYRPAGNRCSLASTGFSLLLALEESAPWATQN